MRRDKTRLEGNSRIGGTGSRLLHNGPVARENLGKNREINGTGWDYSLTLGKVSSGTKFWDFSWKTSFFKLSRPKMLENVCKFYLLTLDWISAFNHQKIYGTELKLDSRQESDLWTIQIGPQGPSGGPFANLDKISQKFHFLAIFRCCCFRHYS